jgi:sugar/nucleoside kinase (ribokinase family)
VWAAGAHVKGFCKSIDVATATSFTIKRRFVELERVRKLFEVHEEQRTSAKLDPPPYSQYDLVIVTDFGHGAITPPMIEEMIEGARFLAVNAQTNSANHGFNLITKYRTADLVVLDELEARLAAHDRDSPIESVIERLGFKKIIVTLGNAGCIGYDGAFHREPSHAEKVVDTMGAGDAFFCVAALFAAAGADMPTLCRVGNAAGAIKCGVIGHRQSVTPAALSEHIGSPRAAPSER